MAVTTEPGHEPSDGPSVVDPDPSVGGSPPEDGDSLPAWLDQFGPGGRGWRVAMGLAVAFLLVAAGLLVGRITARPSSDAVDVGFLVDMSSHHDQAVALSLLAQANGSDPAVQGFAREVVLFQRFELGKMDAYLEARGETTPDETPDRPVMRWMGMGTTLSQMPGMASPADVQQLKDARGTAADVLWLKLIIQHHRGGLHMADYARDHASDRLVRDLASVMARNQTGEIVELQRELDRLDPPSG